jgi:hypothetical protein
LRFLFPLLALVGPLVFFYYGHMGVTRRKTLLFGRRTDGSLALATWLEGTSAVVWGVIYIVSGILCACLMVPIAGTMLGLW